MEEEVCERERKERERERGGGGGAAKQLLWMQTNMKIIDSGEVR